MTRNRYAMLTVDAEALPKRASTDHVKRLIWGEHDNGTAGIREMCAISDEVGAKHVFFVDVCGAYDRKEEVGDAIRWLDQAGHDVQLHTHPEYLPEDFWRGHGFRFRPRFLNQYDQAKAEFTVAHFGKFVADITGKPIRAFRAGSFRWNANTIRALEKAGIPLSFNNSTSAFLRGQSVYSERTNRPFTWSNGVVEVPVTERQFSPPFADSWWGRLQFPAAQQLRNPPWRVLAPHTMFCDASFLVLLLHSWSLLYWNVEGHAAYCDDKRVDDYRKLVRKLAKDYDIITTADFLDLQQRGKIAVSRRVELSLADIQAANSKPAGPRT